MKLVYLLACTGMAVLTLGSAAAQKSSIATRQGSGSILQSASDSLYINYNDYIRGLGAFAASSPRALWRASMKTLHESAGSMQEETPPAERVKTVAAAAKVFSDEEVYAARKQGVFMIGKLYAGQKAGDTLFEIKGTAFAISEDGVCVTNYHVLQDLIRSKGMNNDLVYFILGTDRKVFIMDRLLAFSKNNDMVVFKVNTEGEKLRPIPLGQPAGIGATVYCISHPGGQLFYFTKGMVARNIIADSNNINNYSGNGRAPLRMEITAEYGAGSSGGPVLDKYGNLVGIIATTYTIYLAQQEKGNVADRQPQMVVRGTVPVKALIGLINL